MFEQVKLSYAYDALEPYVDALTMETHYAKHHKTYTANFNAAVEKAGLTDKSVEEILGSLDSISDEGLKNALKNNGGGYYNHNLYFSTISPDKNTVPTGKLAEKINEKFGSFDNLKEELTKLAIGQFGSGWAFLAANKAGELATCAMPNQNNPISEGTDFVPIVGIDVWEHAYYLKYKNVRPDYVKALFEVLDWVKINELYESIIG